MCKPGPRDSELELRMPKDMSLLRASLALKRLLSDFQVHLRNRLCPLLPCADLAWCRCKESSSQYSTHWFTREGSNENMMCPMSRTGPPRYLRPQNYHSHPFAIRKVAVNHLSRGKQKETPGAQTGFTEHLLCSRSSGYSLVEFSEAASQGKL